MSTTSKAPPVIVTETATFIGIDYHKKYSVWHAVDAAGSDLGKGRIEHHSPHDFATLVRRWPRPHVVFEATMNWYWLYEVLERSMPAQHITLANPFKTRIIAEAQVKTDSRPKGDSQPQTARQGERSEATSTHVSSRCCCVQASSAASTFPARRHASAKRCCGSAASLCGSAPCCATASTACSAHSTT